MMDEIETTLKDLILNQVEFKINDKVIRRGRLKIFNTKQFFIKFTLETGEVERIYELPYPYDIIKTPNGVVFDYCLSAICPPTEEIYYKMLTCNKENASKLHNEYLNIVSAT